MADIPPMHAATGTPPAAGPPPRLAPGGGAETPHLTAEHIEQVALARLRGKKVRRAATMALVNTWLLGVFSGGSFFIAAVGALLGEADFVGLVMGAGLGLLAWNELRGRRMLLRMETRGCRVLGWNQLALMALIIAYAAWMLVASLRGPGPVSPAIAADPMAAGMARSIERLYRTLSMLVYGALIVGTLIFQGLNAAYYFTRRRYIEQYVRETPEWVVQLQRSGVVV